MTRDETRSWPWDGRQVRPWAHEPKLWRDADGALHALAVYCETCGHSFVKRAGHLVPVEPRS